MSIFTSAADLLDPPTPEGALGWYCNIEGCSGKPHGGMAHPHARAKQCPPSGYWYLWFIRAGRGFGKTRTGGEWLVSRMRVRPNTFWGLVAPTFDDGRDTMVEGESGLEFVLDRHKIRYKWNRSLGQLILFNGARLDLFSSETPEALRGPNLSGAWGDEPATWKNPIETWDNLTLMTRVGKPQIVLTGTPRPSKFVKHLLSIADHVTVGNSYENESNLSAEWFDKVVRSKEGTRLGRQEIHAEVLQDTEGALWTLEQIDSGRLLVPGYFDRVVVAVDPSASDNSDRDECGIVVGGRKGPQAWVYADWSSAGSPEEWGRRAIDAYYEFEADAMVAEGNKGGDIVKALIHTLDRHVHVKMVHATRGKRTRAEPVAALYGDPANPSTWEKARAHHAHGVDLSILEDQMTSWVQGDRDSPDRMDASVWLMTELLVGGGRGRGGLRHRQ